MINKPVLWCLLVVAGGALVAAAYSRPYRWWPINDMTEQPTIKPFHPDGLRGAPEGSVALDEWEVVPDRLEILTGQHPDFKNPVPLDEASVKKGEELYTVYCYTCHGTEMASDKKSPVQEKGMPGFAIEVVQARPDEYIFSTITHGGAIMKRMDYHLSPEERWHVVNYIRSLINDFQSQQ